MCYHEMCYSEEAVNELKAERDALAKRVEELERQLRNEREAYNNLRQSIGNIIGITGLAERRAGRAK